jgi:signal transduction histidine kinase
LDNLLTNALKYSKGKPVIVLGAYIDQDSSPNKLIIYVKDNGIGIAKKHLPHIFDRSYTANKSRTPNSSNGSGFGLSIVKSIVEHHDGLITCESEQGVGSRFEIQLNLPSC